MRVREGDCIGTKDGRFGVITLLVTQENFLVEEIIHPDDLEPGGTEINEFQASIRDVASIR
ncbi:MAG: hypothetical protein WBK76_02800 [Candidatus Saccharimonadales bacterium]